MSDKTLQEGYLIQGYMDADIAGYPYKVDPYHADFWGKAAAGTWEPNTYKILSHFLTKQKNYCDIGAWIGPTVMHASQLAKQVICFEPDPTAYRYLRWNIDLNKLKNVTSYSFALAETMSISRMASHRGKPGDSMTSLLFDNEGSGVDVLTLKWEQFLSMSPIQQIDVMKIDIEGGEYQLMPSLEVYLTTHKPVLYLSTHAPLLAVEDRKAKMQGLIDVLSLYKTCLDDSLQPIDINTLVSEDALDHFRSYVFMD
ncbi:MAG: FkbM family methyltransferase [Oceanospirillaceae bacterium]